ncbi:MAG: ferredoxin [Synergistaceae bacterium]|nr:ferredoxin [Synergistaceae bacterium]
MNMNIDFNACIGCGVCMQVCPAVFGLDDDAGKAVLLNEEKIDDNEELIKEAIDSCPIGCIGE